MKEKAEIPKTNLPFKRCGVIESRIVTSPRPQLPIEPAKISSQTDGQLQQKSLRDRIKQGLSQISAMNPRVSRAQNHLIAAKTCFSPIAAAAVGMSRQSLTFCTNPQFTQRQAQTTQLNPVIESQQQLLAGVRTDASKTRQMKIEGAAFSQKRQAPKSARQHNKISATKTFDLHAIRQPPAFCMLPAAPRSVFRNTRESLSSFDAFKSTTLSATEREIESKIGQAIGKVRKLSLVKPLQPGCSVLKPELFRKAVMQAESVSELRLISSARKSDVSAYIASGHQQLRLQMKTARIKLFP